MSRMKRLLSVGLIGCFCSISAFVYGKAKEAPFMLTEMKCENLVNPLGIDNTTPHFSWKLKGDGLKGRQAYYEIQVASDSILLIQDKADLWNTRGKLKIRCFSNGALSRCFFVFPLIMLLESSCMGFPKKQASGLESGSSFCYRYFG